jgi:hypothetical protein
MARAINFGPDDDQKLIKKTDKMRLISLDENRHAPVGVAKDLSTKNANH